MIGRSLSLLAGCLLLVSLAACGEQEAAEADSIDVQVFPARLDERPDEPAPAGWRRGKFGGSQRAGDGTFIVAEKSLLTGWSLTAFRADEEPDGGRSIHLRLNAAGKKRIAEFVADEANLKRPLAVNDDGRWADFSPLLRPPRARMSLYGFTAEKTERLERWLQIR